MDCVARSVVEGLEERSDMQGVIQQLMSSDDMAQALADVPDDDLKRLTLQASVAALVNTQSVVAITAEIQKRAGLN
jgi:hypothetical protein